ncbi:MAG TPA: outer membrane protein assembly factor BamC [Burkholderiaceae bacterium]|nr:outer membrane protein assembly factor BamC [Burkholderiaceae bacterium]
MKISHVTQRYFVLVLGLGALTLSGCSTWNQLIGTEESVDYQSTVRADPLSIPPDLTQINQDARYRAPEGTASFSQYAQQQQEQRAITDRDRVLPQPEGIRVMRDGDLRWLIVDQPAEDIYPRIIEFWGRQGFTIRNQDPRAGIIETDWAENRAKIPEGWIRRALGAIIDQVFDSGERERFRTRLERVGDRTEIYVSHQHMEETPTADGTTFKWVFGPEDPGLNAAMLARMMVFLGTDVQQAQQLVTQAEQHTAGPDISIADDGRAQLLLGEPFDRAWRRVGVAIDSAGFTVDDRDRSTGDYYVRYLDTDTGEKIEQQNFIGRLFGSRNRAEAQQYRINVAQQGAGSRVTVLDAQGQEQDTETARRILTVLMGRMTGRE